ncbi:MAG TPA: hypothetical protein VNJ08_07405 [Bacteriovoracaceae bacterium]|nr:hypothetical protein [Bacteriovoracaceae bacterium]
MLNKIIFLMTFMIIGCGKDVTIPDTLEKRSAVTQAESQLVTQTGTIVKGAITAIKIEGKTFKISKYTSHMALEHIAALPQGETPVSFRGEVQVDEVIIQRFF